MIKILIDNEEVVSNSNLQIKEEMLSTSSTILINCYPKTWEDDKDYTSRYYFPKDYSKCKILDEEEIDFEIVGSTTQEGSPTPENPIPVINKSGTITENIEGKNYTFNLGEIELNKIDTYEDRIYKIGNKWYLEKHIGKIVLDGTENWEEPTLLTNTTRFSVTGLFFTGVTYAGFSDYFTYINNSLLDEEHFYVTATGITIFLPQTIATTIEELQTWLSTNNVVVYYVMFNAITTEITDETLLSQLNNVGKTLLFCGLIKNTGKISLNPREPHYVDLQILDFKDLLSTGETLNYVISGKTITEAINQVVASISDYGFVVGNINILNPDEQIGAYSTLNKTAYDVFQYFADITQSRWSTRVIDENTIAIDFIDPTLMPTGTEIENTTTFYKNNEINDISFSYSTNDYRNKQIITSDEVFGNIIQTETKVADGYTKNFMCDNKIGQITGITLNGTSATFITKSEEELGLSGDFIYQPGENTFTSSNTITTGGVIVISYYPIVKGREIVLNPSEISRINEQINRKGTISRYENRNDTTSSNELQKIGQSYIKYKGQAEITLKIVSNKNIWEVGEIVKYNAPIDELELDYMVKSKTIDMYLNANKIFYTYELTSNFNYENAVNYFDNQRAKNQGNIGEGEVINRNIDLTSEALILFYDTDFEEISSINESSLDFGLDGVLI